MVGSHKILTVSYGTFSCTLEGFEDSFGTMKAIAEYFRDLAADDRYFGAEPPVPDAEMLARIAEREIARRVEARMDTSGIVLRVGQSSDPVATMRAADVTEVPAPAPVTTAPDMTDMIASPVQQSEPLMPPAPVAMPHVARPVIVTPPAAETRPAPEPEKVAVTPLHPDSDSVAAKLQRIRAVVGKGSANLVEPDSAEDGIAFTPMMAAPVATLPPEDLVDEQLADILAKVVDATAAEEMPHALTETAVLTTEELLLAEVEPEPENEAVLEHESEVEPEIEAVLELEPEVEVELAIEAVLELEPELEVEPAIEAVLELEPELEVEPAIEAALNLEPEIEPESEIGIAADAVAHPAPEVDTQEPDTMPSLDAADLQKPEAVAFDAVTQDAVATPPAPIRARVIKMRRADFDRTVAAGMLVEDGADAAADGLDTMAETRTADAETPVSELAAIDMDEAMEDLDAVSSLDAELVELTDEMADLDDLARLDAVDISVDEPTYDRASDFDATLSPDEEAELMAELAAVENETFVEMTVETIDTDDLSDRPGDIPAEQDTDGKDESPAVVETEATDTARVTSDTDLMNMVAKVTGVTTAPEMLQPVQSSEAEALFDDVDSEATAMDDDIVAEDDQPVEAEDLPAEVAQDDQESAPHAHLRGVPEEDEASLSRIMSQTDAELSQPEARNRREAISQLKAAVAATEAARRLGDTDPAEAAKETENLFRKDLQQVVRPRRPMAPQAEIRSERPRPAPLKLVASQRVDLPAAAPRATPAPAMPIRPRRVTVATETTTTPATGGAVARTQATSFAAFAAEKGATGLADLLEAAAAYTSFVEGVEDFSRPQILRKVSELATTPYSREDELRSFGTLLREGRILKASNGRFVVNEETRFNPVRDAG
jgi:hypothetical protein